MDNERETTPEAVNDNCDPFTRADTALTELYKLRRDVLAKDTGNYTLAKWQERRTVLARLEAAIRVCLSKC